MKDQYKIEKYYDDYENHKLNKWKFIWSFPTLEETRIVLNRINEVNNPKWKLRIYGYREKRYISNK